MNERSVRDKMDVEDEKENLHENIAGSLDSYKKTFEIKSRSTIPNKGKRRDFLRSLEIRGCI